MISSENIRIEKTTNSLVAENIYKAYVNRDKVRVYYGDPKTGEDRLELHGVEGVVGVSDDKRPVFVLETDIGIVPIKTEDIVKLDSNGVTVYEHPFYHVPTIELIPLVDGTMTLSSNGKRIISEVSVERARYVFKFINGEINIEDSKQ